MPTNINPPFGHPQVQQQRPRSVAEDNMQKFRARTGDVPGQQGQRPLPTQAIDHCMWRVFTTSDRNAHAQAFQEAWNHFAHVQDGPHKADLHRELSALQNMYLQPRGANDRDSRVDLDPYPNPVATSEAPTNLTLAPPQMQPSAPGGGQVWQASPPNMPNGGHHFLQNLAPQSSGGGHGVLQNFTPQGSGQSFLGNFSMPNLTGVFHGFGGGGGGASGGVMEGAGGFFSGLLDGF